MKKRILIIDDDLDMCTLLSTFLIQNGFETEIAYSGKSGVAKFQQSKFDIVLCDYRLGDKDGKNVLLDIKKHDPNAIVLIITGYSDINSAVEVIKLGAYDYITKPLIPDEVLSILNTINSQLGQDQDNTTSTVQKSIKAEINSGQFLQCKGTAAKELYRQVEMVAVTDYSVILYGESGTGKEVIARMIHNMSKRKDKPFVAMDCGILSKELSGSELFGHVKGAFTGAQNDKEGHFELANGGTLFLDEVANLSYDIQASFLRVVEERKFKRVGGTKEMPLDIRIIVASNESLQEAYKTGKFREDLYHRFNEFFINLPPLRHRKDDIPLFADFFLKKTCKELDKNLTGFDEQIMELFINYSWPGNLSEFKNVIRRAALLSVTDTVSIDNLPAELIDNINIVTNNFYPLHIAGAGQVNTIAPVKKEFNLKDAAFKAEYETIMRVLKEVNFNKTKAAQILNVDRKTLYNKIRNYEVLVLGPSE